MFKIKQLELSSSLRLLISMIFFLTGGHVAQSQNAGSGGSLVFTGSSYVTLGSGTYSSISLPVSVSLWFKPNISSGVHRIFYSHDISTTYYGFWIQMVNGNLQLAYGDGTSSTGAGRKALNVPFTLDPNKWYHLAGVIHSSSSMELYLNGVSLTGSIVGTGGSAIAVNGSSGVIGRFVNSSTSDYLVGELDEVAVWNRALNQTEIRQFMCAKLTGGETGLVGYYRFDDASGSTLTNEVAGSNDGSLMNNPIWVPSSAAVGDTGYFDYTNPIQSFTKILDDGTIISIENISPPAPGVQVYEVFEAPNSLGGLPSGALVSSYLGVYIAGTNASTNYSYDLRVTNFTGNIYGKSNNATQLWQMRTAVIQGNDKVIVGDQNRQEYWIDGDSGSIGLLDDQDRKNNISFAPNPVSDRLYIDIPDFSRDHKIQILGTDSRVLREIVAKDISTQVDISDLKNGIYVIRVVDEVSQTLFTGKFVKS